MISYTGCCTGSCPISLLYFGPFLVGIFTFSLTGAEYFGKPNIFMWFGFGFGLPLLLVSFLAGATKLWIVRFLAQHSRAINLVRGLLLIGAGFYDFINIWLQIPIYLF